MHMLIVRRNIGILSANSIDAALSHNIDPPSGGPPLFLLLLSKKHTQMTHVRNW